MAIMITTTMMTFRCTSFVPPLFIQDYVGLIIKAVGHLCFSIPFCSNNKAYRQHELIESVL
jgi:hypothetical protein